MEPRDSKGIGPLQEISTAFSVCHRGIVTLSIFRGSQESPEEICWDLHCLRFGRTKVRGRGGDAVHVEHGRTAQADAQL